MKFVVVNGVSVNKETGLPMLSEEERNRPLQVPRVFGDMEGYTSPIDGSWIEGRRARQYDLEKNDCVPHQDLKPYDYKPAKFKNKKFIKKRNITDPNLIDERVRDGGS